MKNRGLTACPHGDLAALYAYIDTSQ